MMRTRGSYQIHLSVDITGDTQQIVIQSYDKIGPLSSRAQTYQDTDLELALNEEFRELARYIVDNLKV